jgi:hypothetical protein
MTTAGSPAGIASPVRSCAQRTWAPDASGAAHSIARYVEFRVARNGVYGHSYVVHGDLGPTGQPATLSYADVHPNGGFLSMVPGHFIPVPASTTPLEDTLRREVTCAYRRGLTDIEYQAVDDAIARIRASRRSWAVLGYNCNDFCADVARAIGLRTPSTLMRPYRFIPALRRMNEPLRTAVPERVVPTGMTRTA